MGGPLSISVVVPVYNEIGLLRSSTESIRRFLDAHFGCYEIIIVESGSTDGTAEECDRLVSDDPRATVIHEGRRNGFGSAVKRGFAAASCDLVLMTTLDMPFPLECTLEAIGRLGSCDCVLSYRSVDHRSVKRKMQSYLYNTVIKTILGLDVRHVNSAFKLYKIDVVRSMPLQTDGWLIDAEITLRLKQRNVSYIEIPVPLIERTQGTTSLTIGSYVNIVRELYALVLLSR